MLYIFELSINEPGGNVKDLLLEKAGRQVLYCKWTVGQGCPAVL